MRKLIEQMNLSYETLNSGSVGNKNKVSLREYVVIFHLLILLIQTVFFGFCAN